MYLSQSHVLKFLLELKLKTLMLKHTNVKRKNTHYAEQPLSQGSIIKRRYWNLLMHGAATSKQQRENRDLNADRCML